MKKCTFSLFWSLNQKVSLYILSTLSTPEIEKSWWFHDAKGTSVQQALNTLISTENDNLLKSFGTLSKLKNQIENNGVHVKQTFDGLSGQILTLCKALVSF